MEGVKREQLDFLNWEFGKSIKELNENFIPCEKALEGKKLTLTMELSLVNHVILQEEIDGTEISQFEIRAYPHPYGAPVTVFRGATIGHKAICPFPTLRTSKIEVIFDKEKPISGEVKYLPRY